jgi:hypothetical protein
MAPDTGEIKGIDAIVEYLGSFLQAFPDGSFEEIAKHETGDTAIDEGYFSGHTPGRCSFRPASRSRRPVSECGSASATSRASAPVASPAIASTSTKLSSASSSA